MHKQSTSGILIAVLLILIAATSRVVLYPHNFSPVIGMAIFAGAIIKDKKLAFILPLAAMLLSDLMFEVFNIAPGFWGWGQLIGYGILALITVFAFTLKKINVINVVGYSIASSLLFFFLSNSSVWLFDKITYPQNFSGWMQCLAAGIPFLKNGMVADLTYSAILFGSYYLMQRSAHSKKVTA
ncbi:MAG: DUF6580 family putative transport protein [Ferruginibacter sp.]